MNEPRTYPEGVTCWVDIDAADVEEAARFYGVLFGWKFIETEPKRRYLVARLDGQDAAGIGQLSGPDNSAVRSPSWNTYVSVEDVDQAVARIVAAGGRGCPEPRSNLAEAALTASCVDAEGIPFRFGRPMGGPAYRLQTFPARGISVTCTPPTGKHRLPSTRGCSAGSSTTSVSRP